MTKHQGVNKCRRKEKCKMAALIRQANSGDEMANRPQTKKKKKNEKKKNERGEKKIWKERQGKKCQRPTWQRLDTRNPCARTPHVAVTTTLWDNRRSRTTPHKERTNGIVKHRDYPPHSYIVNERYNSRNKTASKERKPGNGRNRFIVGDYRSREPICSIN